MRRSRHIYGIFFSIVLFFPLYTFAVYDDHEYDNSKQFVHFLTSIFIMLFNVLVNVEEIWIGGLLFIHINILKLFLFCVFLGIVDEYDACEVFTGQIFRFPSSLISFFFLSDFFVKYLEMTLECQLTYNYCR